MFTFSKHQKLKYVRSSASVIPPLPRLKAVTSAPRQPSAYGAVVTLERKLLYVDGRYYGQRKLTIGVYPFAWSDLWPARCIVCNRVLTPRCCYICNDHHDTKVSSRHVTADAPTVSTALTSVRFADPRAFTRYKLRIIRTASVGQAKIVSDPTEALVLQCCTNTINLG